MSGHHHPRPLRRRIVAWHAFLASAAASAAVAASEPLADAIKLFDTHHPVEARAAFEKFVAVEPKNAEATYYLGLLALEREDLEQAVKWLEQATAVAPAKSAYFVALGNAYGGSAEKAGIFSKFGLAKKCLAAWDRAIVLDPDNLEARADRLEYYRQAPGIAGGGMDKAYAEAAEIRRRDSVRGAQALVDLYVVDKKFPEAFAVIDETIKAHPEKKALTYQIGRLAAISGQQLDRGEAALKEYLRFTPAAGEPALAAAHWRLGNIYEKQGDNAAARAEYEAALKINPQFGPAQAALKKLP